MLITISMLDSVSRRDSDIISDESVCLNTVNGYVCCICIDDVDEEQLKESLKSGKGS